jgi:hypothetical protein
MNGALPEPLLPEPAMEILDNNNAEIEDDNETRTDCRIDCAFLNGLLSCTFLVISYALFEDPATKDLAPIAGLATLGSASLFLAFKSDHAKIRKASFITGCLSFFGAITYGVNYAVKSLSQQPNSYISLS